MSIVEYLLDEAHANPLIKNNFGEAAYDVSAAAGESYICEMLEKAGRRWWHHQHTEGVLNPGNKRASKFGATYDLLEFHVTVIVILHENQRATSLLGLSRPQFSENYLMKTDARGPWSLHPSGTPSSKEMVNLPATSTNNHRISNLSNWFWLTDWQLDYSNPRVDPTSGWQYSKSFNDDDDAWTPVAPTSGYSWVRRRRWVRVMKRRMDLTKGSHRGDSLAIANIEEEDEDEGSQDQQGQEDYLLQVEAIINQTIKLGDATDNGDTVQTKKHNLEKYKQAIDLLNTSIQDDGNEFRKHQALTLIKSYTAQVDKLAYQIEHQDTEESAAVQPQSVDEPTNVNHLNQHDETSNPWSNNLTQEFWPPQNMNTVDLFTPESTTERELAWESDLDAHSCRVCDRKFGLLFSRRHHCRKCGLVVCDKCSPWKVFLNASDILQDPEGALESASVLASQQQRVCDKCYDHHQQQQQ
ncbi:FYVE zinc finger-domain-containing protein [Parasitella parasitica]|nr:FYVE zinc finger-domain-containing protein [Parasitella parasitica]